MFFRDTLVFTTCPKEDTGLASESLSSFSTLAGLAGSTSAADKFASQRVQAQSGRKTENKPVGPLDGAAEYGPRGFRARAGVSTDIFHSETL